MPSSQSPRQDFLASLTQDRDLANGGGAGQTCSTGLATPLQQGRVHTVPAGLLSEVSRVPQYTYCPRARAQAVRALTPGLRSA